MGLNLTVSESPWQERIAAAWRASLEAIFETGRLLGEAKAALPHGEFTAMIEADLPFSPHTAQVLMKVARDERLTNPSRATLLPPSWYALSELSRLSDADLDAAFAAGVVKPDMERAQIKAWKSGQRRAAVVAEGGCTIDDLETLALDRPGEFAAILVDVPSEYKTFSEAGAGRSPEMHYGTMSVAELIAMGPIIRALAAKDTALLYWTSGPNLRNSFRIVEAWADDGTDKPVFRYSTKAFAWVKLNPNAGPAFAEGRASRDDFHKGPGHWTRSNGEDVLLFLKGHPPRLEDNVDELVIAPRAGHSAKPVAVHEGIEALVAGPYLELFGREERPGWTVWGNQAHGPSEEGEA